MEINKELIKLISENPDLPIYAWVEEEVCGSGEFAYYLGNIYKARIEEILICDEFEQIFTDKDDFKETYYEAHDDELDLDDYYLEEKLEEICNKQNWQKAILVYVEAT